MRAAQNCSRERSRETVVRFVSPIIVSGLSIGGSSPQRVDASSNLRRASGRED